MFIGTVMPPYILLPNKCIVLGGEYLGYYDNCLD